MRSVAIVCVRALAAYLIFFNANTAAMMLATQLSIQRKIDAVNVSPLIVPLAMTAVGLVMLFWSTSLADLATRDIAKERLGSADSRMAAQIGTALLGMYVIATALPHMAGALWRHFSFGDDASVEVQVQRALTFTSLVQAIVGIAVGGLLLLLSQGISNLGIFRTSTTPPAPPPPPSR